MKKHFEIDFWQNDTYLETCLYDFSQSQAILRFIDGLDQYSMLEIWCLNDSLNNSCLGSLQFHFDKKSQLITVYSQENTGFMTNNLTKQQAQEILEYWLPNQQKSPNYDWEFSDWESKEKKVPL